MASPESIALLHEALSRSRRQSTVQIPVGFVRAIGGVKPPVARLMAGGRGGSVRLSLLLTLTMMATRAPHTLPPRTADYYARVLDLAPPTGARRVNEAFRWLERENFISRQQREGHPPQVTVLSLDGSGQEWVGTGGTRWIGLPLQLWEYGLIVDLPGRALAVYCALRELLGGRSHPDGEFMTGYRKLQYGMSDDTWTRAIRDLEGAGLLRISVVVSGGDEHYRRIRRRYQLIEPIPAP